MRWFKVAAIAVGVVIALLVVSSVIGFLLEAAIAALVVATVVLAVKVAFYRGQVSRNRRDSEVRGPTYNSPLPRHLLAGCRRRAGPAEARDGRLVLQP
jgi:membrane protein implicated in regulation of membrane protease activity